MGSDSLLAKRSMPVKLPPLIQHYIDASNAHDVKSILECFADDDAVRDENATCRGKMDIERWITTTIEKYKFQFKPPSSQERDTETVVSVEVSGTFPGSPVSLDYHFTIVNNKIASLTIGSCSASDWDETRICATSLSFCS